MLMFKKLLGDNEDRAMDGIRGRIGVPASKELRRSSSAPPPTTVPTNLPANKLHRLNRDLRLAPLAHGTSPPLAQSQMNASMTSLRTRGHHTHNQSRTARRGIRQTVLAVFCPAALGLLCQASAAQPMNGFEFGIGQATFNVRSGEMFGPPGTTPPGIRADVDDKQVWTLTYVRQLSGPWSLVVQGGIPPSLSILGAGDAAALGQVGSVRAWFPALLVRYTQPVGERLTLHAAAGMHYTFFTGGKVFGSFDEAVGGTSSSARFRPDVGPAMRVGAGWSLNKDWYIDASYTRYWIDSQATISTLTPGFGIVERKINLDTQPAVWLIGIGRRF